MWESYGTCSGSMQQKEAKKMKWYAHATFAVVVSAVIGFLLGVGLTIRFFVMVHSYPRLKIGQIMGQDTIQRTRRPQISA